MWNNLWSVSRYVMGPLSGRWRQSGNDQQCLAAPIWKYRSGFGDHRFTFFIDLRPNYTFYTNLTNIVHWVVANRDVAHLVRFNLGKSWEKSAKSFNAGLSSLLTVGCDWDPGINKLSQLLFYTPCLDIFAVHLNYLISILFQVCILDKIKSKNLIYILKSFHVAKNIYGNHSGSVLAVARPISSAILTILQLIVYVLRTVTHQNQR